MSNNRFFEPIAFKSEFVEETRPRVSVFWDSEKLKETEALIKEELERIRMGISNYSKRAVDPGKFGFPAMSTFKAFLMDPNDTQLTKVVEMFRQDLGGRVGVYFGSLIKLARTEGDTNGTE